MKAETGGGGGGGGGLVQHSCFIQTEKKLSGSYLVVSIHTLGPCSFEDGLGGGGGGTSSMRHVRLLVWLSVHGFASWSAPEAILFSRSFHSLLDPVYRVCPTSHTKRSVSAGTWYRRLYFSPVLGKHLPVKTGICRSSGGSGVFHVLEEQGRSNSPTSTPRVNMRTGAEGAKWDSVMPAEKTRPPNTATVRISSMSRSTL